MLNSAFAVNLSSEAKAMATMYDSSADLSRTIRGCASSLELSGAGYGGDVEAALDVDSDGYVPILSDGAFTAG